MNDPTGLVGLFIGSFLASTLLPGGSEAMLLFAIQHSANSSWLLWLIATLGNTLGGLTSWLIGWWLARRFPARALGKPQQQRALARLSRYGSPILLLSWLPVIGDPLCVAAGWSGIKLIPATIFMGCGKAFRYAAIVGLLNL